MGKPPSLPSVDKCTLRLAHFGNDLRLGRQMSAVSSNCNGLSIVTPVVDTRSHHHGLLSLAITTNSRHVMANDSCRFTFSHFLN